MRRGNILPIALMAFALVAFLFVLDYSISGGKWPWSVNKTKNTNVVVTMNGTVNTNVAINTKAVGNTNTPTNANTSAIADWKTYANTTLGYSIKYPPTWTQTDTENVVEIVPPETVAVHYAEGSIRLLIQHVNTLTNDLVTSSKKVTVNGINATQQTEGGLGVYTSTYFPTGLGYIVVTYDQDVTRPEFAQILSTFMLVH